MQGVWHRAILTRFFFFILHEADSKCNQGCHTLNIRVQKGQKNKSIGSTFSGEALILYSYYANESQINVLKTVLKNCVSEW